MELIPWILLGILLLEHIVFLPALFERAGLNKTHGFIPGLNYWTWLKTIGRPWYWLILLVIPGVNLIMLVIMHVELGINFGERSTVDQWKQGALPWVFLPVLSRSGFKYVGKRDWNNIKKSTGREWGESILWALVVATVVRTFIFEAFMIPTGSMEGSMLVGDYLYVSKTSYGPKVPQTPFSVPLIHNALPGSMVPSYTEWFALPYTRLPGIREVERYDAVVFNFPHGDTIVVDPQWAGHDYYAILRMEAIKRAGGNVETYVNDPAPYEAQARAALEKRFGIRARPLDKTENYVKRCVALPGETISAEYGQLFINGEALDPPAGVQCEYTITFSSLTEKQRAITGLDLTDIDTGLDNLSKKEKRQRARKLQVIWALTADERTKLENSGMATNIERVDLSYRRGRLEIFPNTYLPEFNAWDPDNFGPITLPSRGMTIELTPRNIALYRRAISTYEEHDLEIVGDDVRIDGQPATTYTFGLDYYWMMGDNRHRSADSRMWGFVPETHIVGRASFVWFSKQNAAQHGESKIRWDRMFNSVK